tara:strand:- start:907 stop:1056 length:150 start_codon:yes stop_codon:yes gene_type:complete
MKTVNLTREQLVILQDLVSKERFLIDDNNKIELANVVAMNELFKDLLIN